jgi:NADP-dependent 3-hydroxy acid dehydrogenase YdfG
MTPRNRGTIIQVGSALSFRGIPLQSAYCGAKHAIKGYRIAAGRVRAQEVGDPTVRGAHAGVNTPQFD